MGAPPPVNDIIPAQALEHYFELTRRALAKVKIVAPERSHLRVVAEDFKRMAEDYFKDAQNFRERGDLPRALGAVYYSHAWLDAGARLGAFDVGGDSELFTLAA